MDYPHHLYVDHVGVVPRPSYFHGSQTKTLFHEGPFTTATIFVKESIAFSTLPHHGQEGVRENVYLVDERRKGWHGNSFHTLFFTQCSKTLKRYF